MKQVKIDLYIDFCCPWCLIGMARVAQALDLVKGELEVDVAMRPFLLDPGAPDGGVNVHQKLREKHGVQPEQVFPRIEAAARASGIPLDLMAQPMAYASTRAHALVAAAASKGTAFALANALIKAYFLELRAIDKPEILADIVSGYGFGRAEAFAVCEDTSALANVKREARIAVERGVHSVPTMILGDRHGISASSSPAELAAVMRQSANADDLARLN
jgi:predicted DsbA family dithiol-disulfide isomerase